jgi:hypothetical protein
MPHTTRELVAEFHSSKLPQKLFCKERSISLSTLQYHLQKFRKNGTSADDSASRPRFVPLVPQLPVKRSSTVIIKGEWSFAELVELVKAMGA